MITFYKLNEDGSVGEHITSNSNEDIAKVTAIALARGLTMSTNEPLIVHPTNNKFYTHDAELPPIDLTLYKRQKRTEINEACSSSIIKGFWHTINEQNLHFSYDVIDQMNFIDGEHRCGYAEQNNLTLTHDWNGYTDEEHDNLIVVTLNVATFIELYNAGRIHKDQQMEKAKALKQQLQAATTQAEVDVIVW